MQEWHSNIYLLCTERNTRLGNGLSSFVFRPFFSEAAFCSVKRDIESVFDCTQALIQTV
ncbi:hypothetical protein DALLNEIH_01694 [Bacillus sp. B01(2024)]|nr:hypothetical protein SRCM100169_03807 [Bacillus siamensis]